MFEYDLFSKWNPDQKKENFETLFSTNPNSIRFWKINFTARTIRKFNQGSKKNIKRTLRAIQKLVESSA